MGRKRKVRSLAGFELLDKLGQGGMGKVYRARHPRTGAEVAIKVVAGRLAERKEVRERFQREVQAMARVEHPNIVRILEAGEDQGYPFYVMELVDGVDLANWTEQNGRMPPRQLVPVAKGILRALQALHEVGIVHRDLKPHNVMLDRLGRPLIMDLGLIRVEGREKLTHTGALIGSPRYMAPELLSGTPVGPTADLYQTGLVLWECATAETAISGQGFDVVSSKILMGDIVPLRRRIPAFPAPLAEFVHHLCALEPEDRPASAAEALVELEKKVQITTSGEVWVDPDQPALTLELQARSPRPGDESVGAAPIDLSAPAPWGHRALPTLAFAALFLIGYRLTAPAPVATPEALEFHVGKTTVVAVWRGAPDTPVRLVAAPESGPLLATGDLIAVPPDGSRNSTLELEGLRAGTRHRVWLEYPGGASKERVLETISALYREGSARLQLVPDEPARLHLGTRVPAQVELRYARLDGDTTRLRSEEGLEHHFELPGADLVTAGGGFEVKITLPLGEVENSRVPLRALLTESAERLLTHPPQEDLNSAFEHLRSFQRIRSAGVTKKIRKVISDLAIPAGLEEFLPLAPGFFADLKIDSALRVRVVNRIEQLRLLRRALETLRVKVVGPDPVVCLAGPYSLEAPYMDGFSDVKVIQTRSYLAGNKDRIIDVERNKSALTVTLAGLRRKIPDAGRITLETRGPSQEDRYFVVTLPGGLTFFLFRDRQAEAPDAPGLLRRGFSPHDLAPEGGELEVRLQDVLGAAVGGQERIPRVLVGTREES